MAEWYAADGLSCRRRRSRASGTHAGPQLIAITMGETLINLVLSGLSTGGLYAVIALGFSLVAGVMRLLNLAHGEILVGSVFLMLALMNMLHLDPFIAMLGALPIVFVIAYVVQRTLLQQLLSHSAESLLVATFGLSIAGQAIFQLVFGPNAVSLDSMLGFTGVDVLGHTMRWISVVAIVFGVGLTTLTYLLLTYTTFGKSLRAAAEDVLAAQSLGVDVRHVFALCLGLGAVLTACGAVIVGIGFSVSPTSGMLWLIRAVTVVVIGGMGSVWGTLFAAILVGVAEEVGVLTFGPAYRDLVVFSILILVLVIRPSGLFAKELR
nr:branched-chain amino acid ABC transporter, permease protein [uncultured bacterium]BAH89939.1 branched-chain amino acid ABC transporter, permease protein [uncultured bacterium]BAH90353.1 branched-chain amino acid ABC transporter, permease protein [uncultured bacterium]